MPDVVLPAPHAVHALLPSELVYDPIAHLVEPVALAGQYDPAGQIVQLVAVALA